MTPAGRALLEPRTAAGRALLALMPDMMTEDEAESFILAIEAESAAPLRAALSEAELADLINREGLRWRVLLPNMSKERWIAARIIEALAANPPAATEEES